MSEQITIAIDFDGVLHRYSKGWWNGEIYDVPVSGSRDACFMLHRAGARLIVYTTRAYERVVNGVKQRSQLRDVQLWLQRNGYPEMEVYTGPGKPIAHVYVDDRIIRFQRGQGWWTMLHLTLAYEQIMHLRGPWSHAHQELVYEEKEQEMVHGEDSPGSTTGPTDKGEAPTKDS